MSAEIIVAKIGPRLTKLIARAIAGDLSAILLLAIAGISLGEAAISSKKK